MVENDKIRDPFTNPINNLNKHSGSKSDPPISEANSQLFHLRYGPVPFILCICMVSWNYLICIGGVNSGRVRNIRGSLGWLGGVMHAVGKERRRPQARSGVAGGGWMINDACVSG